MKMQIIGRIMFLNMVCGIMCLMACHQPVTAPKTAVRKTRRRPRSSIETVSGKGPTSRAWV
jgi:hypothetical protein